MTMAETETSSATTPPDTLPEWLHQRFGMRQSWAAPWERLSDDDRAYWAHEAAAVRRAVARGGFKNPAPAASVQDGEAGL